MAPLLKMYFSANYGSVDSLKEMYPGEKKSFLLSFETAAGKLSRFVNTLSAKLHVLMSRLLTL